VFLPSNTTKLVNRTGQVRVKWNTTTTGYIYGKLQYKGYDQPYTEYITKTVNMKIGLPSSITAPLAEGSSYDVNCAYTFGSGFDAAAYEWSVSGNATLSSTSTKQVSLLTTDIAGTATVGLRILGCNSWSPWTYRTINVAPIAPTVSLSGTTAVAPSTQYTFTASGASSYEWSVSGNLTLVSTTANQATVTTNSNFTTGMVYVRGKNCGTWSSYASKSLYLDCIVPSNVKIGGATTVLCPGKSYTYTASATSATEYSLTYSGNFSSVTRSGNKITVVPSSSFTGGTVSVSALYRSYCAWSPVQTLNLALDPCCSVPTSTPIYESFNSNNLCMSSDCRLNASGPMAERYEWSVGGNAYAISPTSTTNNWVKIWVTFSNSTSLPTADDVNVSVIAYYCGGTKYAWTSRIYNSNSYYCGPGYRVAFEQEEQQANVYPNPVKGGENLHLSIPDFEIEQVKVFDKVGRLVKQLSGTGNTLEIFTSDLQSGMYVLQVLGATEVKEYKFSVE
jgi:hypothetical protein